jgi:hypothetical protein
VQDYIRRSAALARRGVEGEGAPAAATAGEGAATAGEGAATAGEGAATAGEGAAEDDLNVKSES